MLIPLWMKLMYADYFRRYSRKVTLWWVDLVAKQIHNDMGAYDKFHDINVEYGTDKNNYLFRNNLLNKKKKK